MARRNCYDDIPLDPNSASIRLLRFTQTTCSDTIECELQPFSLAIVPLYRALSYTWGKAYPPRTISVNGRTSSISENLWQFLKQECPNSHGKWYWIDALCIDQCNILERNYQVGMMGRIYLKV